MNLPKQDRNTPRTTSDIERKYSKRINNTEKEVESQAKDLASLNIAIKDLIESIKIINSQIEEINEKYEDLGIVIEEISIQVEENTKSRHSHSNKEVLDDITEQDIESWNDKFDGNYKQLADNITVNQIITGISEYNLVLVILQGINRYIPLYKYENEYKGIVISSVDEGVTADEIRLEVENEKITNITSSYSITKLIGVF